VPAPLTEIRIVAFRKHNNRKYTGRNPNSKANRFKSKLVAKKNLVKARQEVYNKAKEEGLSDMQALVKTFEISPRED
tara:strand:- start:631 stop:861 length:231 start_codon:yes stop_codon:yes gene_type:complete